MTPDDFEPILFDDLTDDDASAELPWLWDGYLMPGDVTMLVSPPKVGKTTLLIGLIRALGTGTPFLGRTVRPGRVWVVSEEPKKVWVERVSRRPLGPHARLLPRPFGNRPTADGWGRLIDRATAARAAGQLDVFVVDPLAHFLPARSESNATSVLDALHTLHRLTTAGVCVLLLHHSRKKPAERGHAARGSTAFTGFVEVTMELSRYSRLAADDHQRRLFAVSRRPHTPDRVEYEWDAAGGEFRIVGDQPERQFQENWEAVMEVLREHPEPLTYTDILHWWPEEAGRPGRSSLFRWLNKAHERGLVRRTGRGVRMDPWRYWLETDADRERDRRNAELDRQFSLPPVPDWNG